MKAYELLKVNMGMLQTLEKHSLSIVDTHHVPVIEEYIRLIEEGEKKTYVVQMLADRFGLGERTIYRMIDKLLVDIAI